jgi:hypothetical protein
MRILKHAKIRRAENPLQRHDLVSPNGAVSQSPGLRGTRYSGSLFVNHFQPQRGCGHSYARHTRHNRVAVDDLILR